MNSKMVLAAAAVALLSGTTVGAFAQDAQPRKAYRPLTVSKRHAPAHAATAPAPVPGPADAIGGLGAAVAAPLNGVAAVGGPVGFGGAVAAGAVGGATTLATAPLAGFFGGAPGISANAAPPLPIKARYANTGPVVTTLDAGYAQEVPVDKSGPIYMIDNGGNDRKVTPFSLLAFPISGATYAITQPVRAVTAPKS